MNAALPPAWDERPETGPEAGPGAAETAPAPTAGGIPPLESLVDIGRERFSRGWLLLLLLIVAAVFFYMVRPFITPVILAGVIASLVYPLQTRLTHAFRGHRGLAALACCLLVALGVVIPVYVAGNFVVVQVLRLLVDAQPQLSELLEQYRPLWEGGSAGQGPALPPPLDAFLGPLQLTDWSASIETLIRTGGTLAGDFIQRTSRNTVRFVLNLFVGLLTLFYFFRDGEQIVARLRTLSPLDVHYEDLLINRLVWASRATLRGAATVAIIQGGLGALTLWITGVSAPLLWGIAMVVLAMIPLLGTWIILYPLAIAELLQGHYWQGITILVVSIVIISNLDNILRPRLVGGQARMHDLLVFFSTLGGIRVFGFLGVLVGPIIGALFLALLDIYRLEFEPHRKRPPRASDAAPPEASPG